MKKLKFVLFLIIALLTVVFCGTIGKVYAAGIGDKTFNVNVTTIVDDDTSDTTQVANQQHGKRDLTIGLSAPIAAGYSFAFYIANGKKYTDVNQNFTVTSNLNVVAVLKPADKYVAVFLDANGKLVDYDYVAENGTPTAPSTVSLSKPGYQINAEQPWSVVVGPLTSDQVYVVNYEKSDSSTVTIAVTGGTGAGSYAYNAVVTVNATSENFSHWIDDLGQVVSYNEQYSFTAVENRTLTAVDGTPTPTPIVSMIDVTGIRSGYNSYLGQYELPAGYDFIEAGFLYSSVYVNNLTIDTPNVQMVQSSAFTSSTNEFLRSATTSDSRLVRAYLVAKQGENAAVTYYSSVSTPEDNTGLMIWEAYPAGGNTGATYNRDFVVLYNGTNASINLNGYSIQYASSTGTTFAVKATLTGTIASKGYYVVADTATGSNGSTLPMIVNQTFGLGFGGIAGKIALANNATAIDLSVQDNVVDLIGYGTAASHYETSKTADLSSSTSAKRSSTTDTNDNGTNFTVGALDVSYLPGATFYTVTYDSNEGSAVSSSTVADGDTVSSLETPTLTGYEFGGWFTDDDTFLSEFTTSTVVNSNITVYAKWTELPKYTITFDSNEGSAVDPITNIISGDCIDSLPTPTKTSYTFAGWFFDDVTFAQQLTVSTEITSSQTVYAKWSSEPVPTILRQSDFAETTCSNSDYGRVFIYDIQHGALDSNPSGASSWIYVGGNMNGSTWAYIKFGKKSVAAILGDLVTTTSTNNTLVDASDPNNYIATQFQLSDVTSIVINFTAVKAATTIYLQSSSDQTNWTNVSNIVQTDAISSSTDLTFNNVNIEAATYYRIIFVNSTSTSSNGWLCTLTTVTFYGYAG